MTLSTRNLIDSLFIAVIIGCVVIGLQPLFKSPLDKIESVPKIKNVSVVLLIPKGEKPVNPELKRIIEGVLKKNSPYILEFVYEAETPMVYGKLKESGQVVEVEP